MLTDIGEGIGLAVEAAIARGGNVHFVAERLGEALRAFELRGLFAGRKAGNAGGPHVVAEARHHFCIGADDDEVHGHELDEIEDRLVVGDIERDVLANLGGAGIAGRDEELFGVPGLRQLPRQSMLAAAGTDQQNAHGCSFSLGAT